MEQFFLNAIQNNIQRNIDKIFVEFASGNHNYDYILRLNETTENKMELCKLFKKYFRNTERNLCESLLFKFTINEIPKWLDLIESPENLEYLLFHCNSYITFECIIKKKINLNIKNENGDTILHILCRENADTSNLNSEGIQTIVLLIKSKASINISNNDNRIPLSYIQNEDVYKYLRSIFIRIN